MYHFRRKSLVKQLSLHEDEFRVLLSPTLSSRTSLGSPSGKRLLLRRRSSIQSLEQDHVTDMLAPTVEGRIFHLDKSVRSWPYLFSSWNFYVNVTDKYNRYFNHYNSHHPGEGLV